jgi:ketosteroid isomerase-like protein
MMERLQEQQNSHDAAGMAALFSADYQSMQPVHPNRGFGGSAQVRKNWESLFSGVPDFQATILSSVTQGQTEWGEFEWRGTHTDGSPFLMRGVIIFFVQDGLISSLRLYMEPVESDGGDIEVAVQELSKPPPQT